MILLDEIRGRLDELYSLIDFNIDHALFGGIASTAVYGALMNATAQQIEQAIGMLISHYIPWRAVRSGVHDLGDTSSCSSAITTEMAILCMNRSLDGFSGPSDIFRNQDSIFSYFWGTGQEGKAPYDIKVNTSGTKFAIMGMHYKFGCYAALASGAIYSLVNVLLDNPELFEKYSFDDIQMIRIRTFTRSYEMLGKMPKSTSPQNRKTAAFSIPFLVSRALSKALYKK